MYVYIYKLICKATSLEIRQREYIILYTAIHRFIYTLCTITKIYVHMVMMKYFLQMDSSIYHGHIEHFFTFLAGNTVFSLVSESPH